MYFSLAVHSGLKETPFDYELRAELHCEGVELQRDFEHLGTLSELIAHLKAYETALPDFKINYSPLWGKWTRIDVFHIHGATEDILTESANLFLGE